MNKRIEIYKLLPDKCKIDRAIPKEAFLKDGRIKDNQNNHFALYFVNATLSYVFRSQDGILPFLVSKDKKNEELHIMEVEIKTRSDGWYPIINFARAILEAYSYPLLLILVYEKSYCFFTSISHINSRNGNKNVADKVQGSGWIDDSNRERFSPPEYYYFIDSPHFFPTRDIEKRICKILNEGTTIASILSNWYDAIRDDRAQWAYFYHLSDEYNQSDSIIRSIVTRSKAIENAYDNVGFFTDQDLMSMEDDFWFEESEKY